MTVSELDRLLDDVHETRVALVGDVCLDVCWFLDPSRAEQSIETGLTTQPVRTAWHTPGGVTNVAANLAALGCGRVRLFGVLGDDIWAREVRRLLEHHGVDGSDCLVQTEDWDTQTYIKPQFGGEEGPRFDFGNFNVLHDHTADALLRALEDALPEVDIVVVNEQAHRGIHTPAFRARLIDLMERHPEKKFLADTRHAEAFCPPAGQKMTLFEALRLCGLEGDLEAEETAYCATEALAARCGGPVVVTRNSHGCLVHDGQTVLAIPAVPVCGPVDTTGAGDVFLAGLAAGLAAGRPPVEAAELGTLAAAVTVQKVHQAGVAYAEEIRALASTG